MKKVNRRGDKKKTQKEASRMKLVGNCKTCRFFENGKCGITYNDLEEAEKQAQTCYYYVPKKNN